MAKNATNKKESKKTTTGIKKIPVKTVDQMTFARLIAQKFELTINTVLDIILEEQKLTMRFVNDGYKVIKKNYKTVLESIDFYKKQEILQTLVDEIKIGNETLETKINLHALAGIEIPLTCVVVERLENVKSVYALRGMDFDLQEMEIHTGENPPNDTSQGGES